MAVSIKDPLGLSALVSQIKDISGGMDLDDIVTKSEEISANLGKVSSDLASLKGKSKVFESLRDFSKDHAKAVSNLELAMANYAENSSEANKYAVEMAEEVLQFSKKRWDTEMYSAKKVAEFQKKMQDELTEDIADAGGKFGLALKNGLGGVSKVMGSFTSGKADFKGMLGGLGEGVTNLGKTFTKFAPNLGSKFLGAGGLGNMLTKGGPYVRAVAAIGEAALDADQKVKDMNSEIFKQSNYVDLTGPSLEGLNEKMKGLRQTFLGLNYELGIDDSKEYFSALQGAGIDFQTMSRDTGVLKETMKTLAYGANELGVSFSEGAEFMAIFRKEMGIEDLGKVASAFTDIRNAALESGMNTRELAQSVKKLYDNLGRFNISMGQVTKMFVRFRSIIGKDAAEQMMESLKGGFKESGVKDKITSGLMMGEGRMKNVVTRSAQRGAREFQKNLRGEGERQDLLSRAGLGGLAKAGSTEAMMKQLEGLSEKDRAMKISQIREAGRLKGGKSADIANALASELDSLINQVQGSKGTIRGGGLLRGMEDMDIAGKFSTEVFKLSALGGKFKGGKIHEMKSPEELAALEQAGGYSAKQIRTMQEITRQYAGEMDTMIALAKEGGPEADKRLGELGLKRGANGELLTKEGEAITSFEQYMEVMNTRMESDAKDKEFFEKSSQDMMKDQILATRSVADQINARLGPVMDSVNTYASAIFDTMRKDAVAATRKEAMSEVGKKVSEAQDEYDRIVKMGGTAKEQEKAKLKLEQLKAMKKGIQMGDFEEGTSKEFMMAMGAAEADIATGGSKGMAQKGILDIIRKSGINMAGKSFQDQITAVLTAESGETTGSKAVSEADKKKVDEFAKQLGLGVAYEKGVYEAGGVSVLQDKNIVSATAYGGEGTGADPFDLLNTLNGETKDLTQQLNDKTLSPEDQKKQDKETAMDVFDEQAGERKKENLELAKETAKKNEEQARKTIAERDIKKLFETTKGQAFLATDQGQEEYRKALEELTKNLDPRNIENLFMAYGDVEQKGAFKTAVFQIKNAKGETDPVAVAEGSPANDWVKVGNKIHKFNPNDIAFGVDPTGAKGPLKDLMQGGRGGGVNITINGGDEQRVYNTVKRALLDAGFGNK